MFEDSRSLKFSGKIQKQVFSRLSDFVGTKSGQFTSQKTPESFWDLVDETLPIEQSMELHRLQVQFPSQPKNFDCSFLSPSLEEFFFSFSGNNENDEAKEERPFADSDITGYLENSNQWKNVDDMWVCNKQEFTFDSLKGMCNEFVNGGNTWEYCPALSETYKEAFDFMNGREGDEDFSTVKKRMTELRYITNAELKNDIEKVTGKKSGISLTQLKVPRALTDSLRKLMQAMKKLQASPEGEEEQGEEKVETHESRWHSDRLAPLLEIAAAPISEKKPFEMSPTVIASRSGVIDSTFESGSISEILFSNEDGNAASMPYSSSRAVIPKARKPSFVTDATRKFTAQILLENKYTKSSSAALEILTDILTTELENISRDSALKYHPETRAKVSPSSCVLKTLRDNKYNIKGTDK